jgi:hypothetical protein
MMKPEAANAGDDHRVDDEILVLDPVEMELVQPIGAGLLETQAGIEKPLRRRR